MTDKRFLLIDSFIILKKAKTQLNFDENKFKIRNSYFIRGNSLYKSDFGIAFGNWRILSQITQILNIY